MQTQTSSALQLKWPTDWQWHIWRSESNGCPLPEWTDFEPCRLQLYRPTFAPASRAMAPFKDSFTKFIIVMTSTLQNDSK